VTRVSSTVRRATLQGGRGSKQAPMRTGVSQASVIAALLGGCTASGADVHPPEDTIFFPTGMAIATDESVLFVANANSELRYDSGSVSVLDLGIVDQVIDNWAMGHMVDTDHCHSIDGSPGHGDPDFTETLDCEDETLFMRPRAGARIGNFATDIAVQDLGTGAIRLIVPTRGDPSIAWMNWDGTSLSCTTPGDAYALCDDAHRLTFVGNDPNLTPLPDEPFNAFADKNFAVVTHLTTGAVTLIDSPPDGDAVISDVQFNLFQPDQTTGLRGSTGVAGRTPGMPDDDIVYIGSRSEDRIQMITVGRPVNSAPPFIVPGNWFFLDSVGGNAGSSTDTRGMKFSPTGDRMYLLNRNPPSIQVFDTSIGPTGFPQNKPIGASDICRQASTLVVQDSGDGERVYLTCFQDGQLYVVDPRGETSVEDIITIGRGPYAIVGAANRKRLYVTNFLEDTVAVVDVAPDSPTRNRVVLRIGQIRPPNANK
jgi:DNA-binding beta-propeller fold protein YncE